MFNSLQAQDGYNNILLFTVCILTSMSISLHVFHIPSSDNLVADTLSHHLPSTIMWLSLGLHINLFLPPCNALGWQEWCSQCQTNPGNCLGLPGHVSDFSMNVKLPLVIPWITLHYRHIIHISTVTFCSANFIIFPWTTADTLNSYVIFMSHHIKPNSMAQYLRYN